MEDVEDLEDIYSLIETSRYMFGKMLLEEKYSIGHKIMEFIDMVKPLAGNRMQKRDIEWIE